MRVIPKRPGLILSLKSMQEGVVLTDRTLRDKRRAVDIVCTILKDTVPVLETRVNVNLRPGT